MDIASLEIPWLNLYVEKFNRSNSQRIILAMPRRIELIDVQGMSGVRLMGKGIKVCRRLHEFEGYDLGDDAYIDKIGQEVREFLLLTDPTLNINLSSQYAHRVTEAVRRNRTTITQSDGSFPCDGGVPYHIEVIRGMF